MIPVNVGGPGGRAASRGAGRDAPIGVFDSGVGGLTVLRTLLESLPLERFVYLGDTARLPYGTKSPGSVARYSVQATEALVERGVKALVVACNTASAVALPAIQEGFPELSVTGVLEPGAAAACAVSRSRHIAVIATESTVRGGAYQEAIRRHAPGTRVTAQACQLFVALAEEGWTEGPVAQAVAACYLGPLFDRDSPPDTLVLGCTHFPMLREAIAAAAGRGVTIVDSAHPTAEAVRAQLAADGLTGDRGDGTVEFLATDGVERFARVGSRFLGREIAAQDVQLVDL